MCGFTRNEGDVVGDQTVAALFPEIAVHLPEQVHVTHDDTELHATNVASGLSVSVLATGDGLQWDWAEPITCDTPRAGCAAEVARRICVVLGLRRPVLM